MPCCFSLVEYSKCDNQKLQWLGCTGGCGRDRVCSAEEQELLVGFKYDGQCQNCHSRRNLLESSKEAVELVIACGLGIKNSKGIETTQSGYLESKIERLEIEQSVIREAEEWTKNYAENLWMVLYDYDGDHGLRSDGKTLLRRWRRDPWPGVSFTTDRSGPEKERQTVKDLTPSWKQIMAEHQAQQAASEQATMASEEEGQGLDTIDEIPEGESVAPTGTEHEQLPPNTAGVGSIPEPNGVLCETSCDTGGNTQQPEDNLEW